MDRLKKFLKGTLYTIVGAVIAAVIVIFLLPHNSFSDRFNPTLKEETSFAKVPLDTQTYLGVVIYDKNGQKLPYKLDRVGGFAPDEQYIKITHKGQYVRVITYIPKDKYPGK